MSILPPRSAPPADPRVVDALEKVNPSKPLRGYSGSGGGPNTAPPLAPLRAGPPRFTAPRIPTPAVRAANANAAPAVDLEALRARASTAVERERPAPAATDAPDPGRVLLAVARPDGSEFRVSLHRYEGRPFVRVAPWQRGGGGSWWPLKGKGATVKVRELAGVAKALLDALDAAANDDGGGGDAR